MPLSRPKWEAIQPRQEWRRYVWDEVLEYRVWCHPERGAPVDCDGNDYYLGASNNRELPCFLPVSALDQFNRSRHGSRLLSYGADPPTMASRKHLAVETPVFICFFQDGRRDKCSDSPVGLSASLRNNSRVNLRFQ